MSLLHAMRERAAPFVALRHDLHRHPELGLQEFRTSALLAEQLESWGYQVTRGLATTGLVAQLVRGSGTKRLGLRADMDALPIQEVNGFAHRSIHEGLMHACGHDGHTAMLMAAAQYIAQELDFSGTLNLIFQPAEEHPGGAKLMIEQGLFDKFPCDAVTCQEYPLAIWFSLKGPRWRLLTMSSLRSRAWADTVRCRIWRQIPSLPPQAS
jgi:hippurate hydrolase